MTEPSHIPSWNGLDRHHRENPVDRFIAENRPKQILEYYDEAVKHNVKVYESRYGARVTV